MVSFILVNNSISRGQLQYTDYLIYTNNSDDVNAETLQSSEKGHIPEAVVGTGVLDVVDANFVLEVED